jgi:hypothetical protein
MVSGLARGSPVIGGGSDEGGGSRGGWADLLCRAIRTWDRSVGGSYGLYINYPVAMVS